jgi:hypothetical protein
MFEDSEIFDEYAKIAFAQGLVAEAEEDKEAPKPKTRNKDTDESIQLLYGINPESIFKEDCILDAAHPESKSVGRSYDAMNSIVENLHERQDIMAYIAQKVPRGVLTMERYVKAKEELVNSIIRAAFLFDNRNETALMSLADKCAEQVASQRVKNAAAGILPALVPAAGTALVGTGVAAGAVLAGYLAWGPTLAVGVKNNGQQVIDALINLQGEEYFSTLLQSVYDTVLDLMEITGKVSAYKIKIDQDQMTNPDNTQLSPSFFAEANNALTIYTRALGIVKENIPKWVSTLQRAHTTAKMLESQDNTDISNKFYYVLGMVKWDQVDIVIDKLTGRKIFSGLSESFMKKREPTIGGLYGAIKLEEESAKKYIEVTSQISRQAPITPGISQPITPGISQKPEAGKSTPKSGIKKPEFYF